MSPAVFSEMGVEMKQHLCPHPCSRTTMWKVRLPKAPGLVQFLRQIALLSPTGYSGLTKVSAQSKPRKPYLHLLTTSEYFAAVVVVVVLSGFFLSIETFYTSCVIKMAEGA